MVVETMYIQEKIIHVYPFCVCVCVCVGEGDDGIIYR